MERRRFDASALRLAGLEVAVNFPWPRGANSRIFPQPNDDFESYSVPIFKDSERSNMVHYEVRKVMFHWSDIFV